MQEDNTPVREYIMSKYKTLLQFEQISEKHQKSICHGAKLSCSFGTSPSSLIVLSASNVPSGTAATIMNNEPMVNIQPFGLCQSPINPMVVTATDATAGTLTPMPCMPLTIAPWQPCSPTMKIAGVPALNEDSCLMCVGGGTIKIMSLEEK